MRISVPILSILAASAVASPSSLEVVKRDTTADAITFAANAAGCDVGKCGGVVAAAACIALCLVGRNWPCVVNCVSGGAGSVCPCVSCVPGLGDFVEEQGLCPA